MPPPSEQQPQDQQQSQQQPQDQQQSQQQQSQAQDQQQQLQQQPVQAEDSSSRNTRAPGKSALRRLLRCGIAAIRMLLVLELVSLAIGPLVSRQLRRSNGGDDDDTDSDLDPADCLVDYLAGKTGLVALQLLSNRQLRAAVDNLITEDFQELGVLDRGAELREIVEDIIATREGKAQGTAAAAPAASSSSKERVGLGHVGPLKFRNARPAPLRRSGGGARGPDDAQAAEADEQQQQQQQQQQ